MLKITGVSKTFRAREGGILRPKFRTVNALQDVSLSVEVGESVALIGPNGAGKSTLCKIAAGMVKPSSGTVTLDGTDITGNVRDVSKKIGTVLGPTLINYRLTGYQYLKYFARIYGVKNYNDRIGHLAKTVGLENWLGAQLESYSLGMRARISLIRAIIHDPSFVILDEFTLGLDPEAARVIRSYVLGLGKSILLTTQNMPEAETMAKRIAFISHGRILAFDNLEGLRRVLGERQKIFVRFKNGSIPATLPVDVLETTGQLNNNGELEIVVSQDGVPETVEKISRYGIRSIRIEPPTLEDVYIHFAGERLSIER